MKTYMETYHKVICPQCKQAFTPTQSLANLFCTNHIVCPHCHYKMTPMEVKKTQRKTTWDLIRELFNIQNTTVMKIRKLKYYLEGIQEDNYGWNVLNFSDQDDDYYTVNEVCVDDDGDICLRSDCGYEMTVDDIMEAISEYDDDDYEHVDWDNGTLICDIEGGQYTDDDDDVVMDVCYHNNDEY